MESHTRIVGWLQILLGLLDLGLALLLFGVLAGLGLLGGVLEGGGGGAALLGGVLGTVVAVGVALTALPNLLAGWGVLAYKEWGRILALILAAVNVLKFPLGTGFAIYTFWVMMDDRTEALYTR